MFAKFHELNPIPYSSKKIRKLVTLLVLTKMQYEEDTLDISKKYLKSSSSSSTVYKIVF